MSGKTRVELEREQAEQAAQKYVRVGFQGAPTSYRQVMRYRMTPNNINSLFSCDIEFLQDADTVRCCGFPAPPLPPILPPTLLFIPTRPPNAGRHYPRRGLVL